MAQFKDHFSEQTKEYAAYRPTYPEALFSCLDELCREHDSAWDCATGNGQAARGLAPFFTRVEATDASAGQIETAEAEEKIHFRVAPAEQSGLADQSQDLITVAQALHWFDLAAFYREVMRVLKPGGVLAVWTYNLLRVEPEIDQLLDDFYFKTLGPYWPEERRHVETGYIDLPFPFDAITTPPFAMTADWTLGQLMGYLGTWSALKQFIKAEGDNPLPSLAEELQCHWPDGESLAVAWPLMLRVGRNQ
jgi:SAM-dependent methyltransferase